MWYFIVSIVFFILCMSYRVFDDVQNLVFGLFPAWMVYLLSVMILYIIATLIFGLKTWKDPDEE
jgi:hypothetical protein